ncbi:MAG: DUF3795 domain-containing protein [Ruminococcus sp.]|jgi:hypothetical protein|nr:DUF3795 domain-containing protein [Ruminococcus sp.]
MDENDKISFCGMDCGACAIRESVNCEGCKAMDTPYWDGICEIKNCAAVMGVSDCSYCKKSPCEIILDISLDPETGDDGERLENLRLRKDAREERSLRNFRRCVLGGTCGITAGLLLAGIAGGGLNWFYALGGGDYRLIPASTDSIWIYVIIGAVFGTFIPIIIEILKRYNKNG